MCLLVTTVITDLLSGVTLVVDINFRILPITRPLVRKKMAERVVVIVVEKRVLEYCAL